MSHRSLHYTLHFKFHFCCFVVDFKEQDGEVFDSFFYCCFCVGAVQVLCEFSGSIIYDPATTYNDHTDP